MRSQVATIAVLLVALQLTACGGSQVAETSLSTTPTSSPPTTTTTVLQGWTVITELTFDIGSGAIVEAVTSGVVVLQTDSTVLIGLDGSWTAGEVSPMPIPHSCCGSTDGLPAGEELVLVYEQSTETWILDAGTLTWRRGAERPTDGYVLGSALIEGSLFVVTAAARTGTAVSSLAALDMATGEWQALSPVPSPISVGGATTDGNSLIVTGTQQDGYNQIIGTRNPVTYEYTPGEGWSELPNIPIDGQAATVAWVEGAGLLAWNYDLESALLDNSGMWRVLGSVPMAPAECYPRSFSTVMGVAGLCGGVALFDATTESWQPVPSAFDTRYVVTSSAVIGFTKDEPDRTTMLLYSLTGDESHWLLLAIHEDSGLPPPHVLLSADAYLGYPYPLPDAGIDFRSQVVLVLSIPTGQGCHEQEPNLDIIVIDEDSHIVYGEFTRVPIEPSCVGALRSFAYFVAVDRAALPAEFILQAERELTHPQATASDIVLDTSG